MEPPNTSMEHASCMEAGMVAASELEKGTAPGPQNTDTDLSGDTLASTKRSLFSFPTGKA